MPVKSASLLGFQRLFGLQNSNAQLNPDHRKQSAGKKRVAPIEDESDSDDIIMAASEQPPSLGRRRVLDEESPPQAQNKRLRRLEYVLIPDPSPEDLQILDALEEASSEKENRNRRLTPVESKSPITHRFEQKDSLSPSRQSHLRDPNQISSQHSSGEGSAVRPRRAPARPSYVVDLVSDSDDDILKSNTRPRGRVRKPAMAEDSSDYDDGKDGSAEDDDGDEFDEGSGVDDSSVATATEDDFSEVEKPTTKSKAKAVAWMPSAKSQAKPSTAIPKGKKATSRMTNYLVRPTGTSKGLATSLPPLSEINDIFADITKKALSSGLDKVVEHFGRRPLRVATMCSGTESPILALRMIQDALPNKDLEIDHLFSAEIVPFKQAYIERNFNPPVIFRDITELTHAVKQDTPMATTAYGARVPVPTDIDIVIAGTSCVDFSKLNNHQKGLSDGGESDKTWHAVLNYCTVFRPTIVLLENVKTAYWNQMLADYEEIDYEVAAAHVDTKDFYLPQTRQRGYMVCFDKNKLNSAGVKNAAQNWDRLMGSFRRYASSPVSSFLIPNDQVVARDRTRADETQRDYDWSRCEITQMQYRQVKRLGNARPFTHWQESGAMLIPDNGSRSWYGSQVERVLDTIDAAILRKSLPKNGAYDCRYKTRIWNLSQNIYRDEDNQQFGTIGCITPSGQYFISDAGRAMTPKEILKLQGLPLDMISFTTESPPEVQDLAGNAMSSSVIGSAILSALIAGYKAIPKVESEQRQNVQISQRTHMKSGQTTTVCCSVGGDDKLQVSSLIDAASRAMRRCYCEQGTGMAKKTIQQCRDCGHTTCTACGGNPMHSYRQRPELSLDRLHPGSFEADLRSKLPLRTRLVGLDRLDDLIEQSCKANQKLEAFYDLVRENARDEFYISNFRRTHCLTVTYQSMTGRLELVLDDKHAEWRLYANAPPAIASNNWLRQVLALPVAKSTATSTLFNSPWELREPQRSTTHINITGQGKHMPSWWSRNEMPDFVENWQWEQLVIAIPDSSSGIADSAKSKIEGTYQYLPKCGTACDSLYKKIHDAEADDLYLFLDPTRTGSPDEDRFVFSHNKALLEYDETRAMIATLEPSWRPWDQTSFRNEKEQTPRNKYKQTGRVLLETECVWSIIPEATLRPLSSTMDLSISEDVISASIESGCSTAVALISCKIPDELAPTDQASVKLGDSNFFSQYGWVFEAMRRQLSSEWELIPMEGFVHLCEECSPKRPSLQWKMMQDGDIVPYEDPSGAAAYERSIKNRPEPIAVELTRGELRLGVNLVSLAHRARGRLPQHVQDVEIDWRLSTNSSLNASFLFQPFCLSSTDGVTPFSKDVLTVKMFPKQRLALAWMRQQETGARLVLEQCEEASLPKLGWTVEMRARAPISVRGGICADHPGFGKTITSLALIESQFQDSDAAEIIENFQVQEKDKALLPTAATLIICPMVLIEQWISEIKDKLGYRSGYICIKNQNDLGKHSIQAFQSAKIILVNRMMLGTDTYAERLAAFAGIPGPATNRGRSFGEWLKYATAQVPEHLRIMQKSGTPHLRQHIKQTYADRVKSEEFKVAVPSRRLRGKDYAASNEKKKKSEGSTKAALSAIDTSTVGSPLLEMFYFNRIIIDEFHQYSTREYAAITALRADKRWGLSATPALGDFYDVAQMAGLLDVPLPIGSDARGIMKLKNVRELRKEMTDFERFDSMRTVPSNALHSRIYELHQTFIDTFVRRNIMDFEDMKYDDHLVPAQLDLDHKALYTELSQHLNSLDMRMKKTSKSKTTTREERLSNILEDSESAEEALSKTAAFDPEAAGASSQQSGLDTIVKIRTDEVAQILDKIRKAVVDAQNKEPEPFESWISSRLQSKAMGDQEIIDTLLQICSTANKKGKGREDTKKKTKSGKKDDDDVDEDSESDRGPVKEGKNTFTSIVNMYSQRLLVASRSVRFTRNIQLLQEAARTAGGEAPPCNHSQCHTTTDNLNVGVSALCGHVICHDCFRHMEEKHTTKCPAPGCSASMHNYHLLWREKMGDLQSTKHTEFGAKIDATMDLLEEIQAQGDQAIVFVQYTRQLEHIKRALQRRNKVSSIVVDEPLRASAKIEEFRKSATAEDHEERKTVIVLNASDETAAGSNLQNANHVIFLSPLLRDTQYGYESTMAQAIGRVRRHGQKKHIHVHRMIALDTIDVDILEHRERRNNALTERAFKSTQSLLDTMDLSGESTAERCQLVREDGHFSLRPQSWLVGGGGDSNGGDAEKVQGRTRVSGWEDFSSLVKFSKAYTEDDE